MLCELLTKEPNFSLTCGSESWSWPSSNNPPAGRGDKSGERGEHTPCSSLQCTSQNTHQVTWNSKSKTSHQQQQFLCLSYKPQRQIPKLLYSSSTLGFGSSQKFLHVPELPAHGWRNFVCSPNIKKAPIISNNHTRVFIAKTLLSHSCLCITALLKSHQRGFSQEISMLPEFPQSFASGAGQEGCAPVKDRATEGTGV